MAYDEPHNIPIAIVNRESNGTALLSHQFVDLLDSQLFFKRLYDTNTTAYESVVLGKNILSIVLDEEFSHKFHQLNPGMLITTMEISQMTVHVANIYRIHDISFMGYNRPIMADRVNARGTTSPF
ncbi:unnamed protein product [Oppiella nova]|uniref:Uncharacterized protein n=1 Tax=Oppiella nova TaxID=334625 RepID=A0A7R9M4L5_9ACAR|nr:unnamed protein product [Oppiella nova]CAG2170562.1 unnamed protein product [Oppiella nova]